MLSDRVIEAVDCALRTLFAPAIASRPLPADTKLIQDLSDSDRAHSIGLMRVNHVGEICAQALYSAQALVARDPETRLLLLKSAQEEQDHLAWCSTRLDQLKGNSSRLNLVWYTGAFIMGLTAGAIGDRSSLSFVVETERQVSDHLESHLQQLPEVDVNSRAIVLAMQADETQHGVNAMQAGGGTVPKPVKQAMQAVSKIMTTVAYRI